MFIIALLVVRSRVERVRYWGDVILLKLPLAGSIARSYNLTSFCRTLGLLLKSGVHVGEALTITADTTTNLLYKQAYLRVEQAVTKGEKISKGLRTKGTLFPDMLSHMVAIGESTGNLGVDTNLPC
jgi:type II secretory pathway component PulF